MPLTPETWLEEFTVNLTTASSQSRPRITQLANGNILVSWESSDDTGVGSPTGIDMIGQIFTPLGERIGNEFRLNIAFNVDDEQDGDIAALPGGGFVVVYEDNDATTNSIRLQEFDATGNTVTASESVISDSTAVAAPSFSNPVVAVSSATSVLIVWQEAEVGVETRIVGKIYDPSTDTYSAEISLINFVGTNADPSVTVLNNGNYVIVSETTAVGGDQFISYRIINSAGANVLGASEVIDTESDTQFDRDAEVTALTGGGFVISWTNTDLNDDDIEARVYDSEGVAQGSLITATLNGATDNGNESFIVPLLDGGFLIGFDEDTENNLRLRRYDSAGNQVGSSFVVAVGAGITEPSGTLLEDGRVAITFERDNGEIGLEILDTRDAPNDPGVYSLDQFQIGTIGDDVFTADVDSEFVHGHDGNDTITESGQIRSYFGGRGNDTLIVQSGINADVHDGGEGDDTIDFLLANAGPLTIDLEAETVSDGVSTEQMLGFENVVGGTASDSIAGTVGVNVLQGLSGNDTLNGRGGADTMVGGADDDVYVVDNLGDVIIEGALQGTGDRLAASVTYVLAAGVQIEQMQTKQAAGLSNINLRGNELAQRIFGNAGNNVLNDGGFGGIDTLTGGLGNDTLIVNNAGTIIVESIGGGIDRVAASLNFTLAADDAVEDLRTTSQAGVSAINLTGNALAQTIRGNAGVNTLSDGGAAGADTLTGFAGNDTYIVRNAAAIIVEAAGGGTNDRVITSVNFTLAADDHIEILQTSNAAGTGALNLKGNAIAQSITGNSGTNVLNGLSGNDTLTGRGGTDFFVFSSALGAGNVDTITDFNEAADTIRLQNTVFTGLPTGALAAAAFQANNTGQASDASDRIIYEADTGNLFFDADGDGAGARVRFAILDAGLVLTEADFFVF